MSEKVATSLHSFTPWDGAETTARLKQAFPDAVLQEIEFRGERTLVVRVDQALDVLAFLRDEPECQYDMLSDVTAVHWPGRAEGEFDVVWHLYSLSRHLRLRVRCAIKDGHAPSAAALWQGANWPERETFDMYGIVFDGHPDLRRILMPDDYHGNPLRKEFPLKC